MKRDHGDAWNNMENVLGHMLRSCTLASAARFCRNVCTDVRDGWMMALPHSSQSTLEIPQVPGNGGMSTIGDGMYTVVRKIEAGLCTY